MRTRFLQICMNLRRHIHTKPENYLQISSEAATGGVLDSRVGWPNSFQMFWSYFLLKNKTIQFRFYSIFILSTKKRPKVVNSALTEEKLCLNFWRHKQAKWLLQLSKLSLGSYVSLYLISQELDTILKILVKPLRKKILLR